VSAESKSIELQIDPDVRLAAAAGGAARYFAESAELSSDAVAELQKSVVAACREAFGHLVGEHPHLVVALMLFADRIEIAMTHQGSAEPSVGLRVSRINWEVQAGWAEWTAFSMKLTMDWR
jgi:hypothetical protein